MAALLTTLVSVWRKVSPDPAQPVASRLSRNALKSFVKSGGASPINQVRASKRGAVAALCGVSGDIVDNQTMYPGLLTGWIRDGVLRRQSPRPLMEAGAISGPLAELKDDSGCNPCEWPMTRQWGRLTEYVETTLGAAAAMHGHQLVAERQLNATQQVLCQLRVDLAKIALPATPEHESLPAAYADMLQASAVQSIKSRRLNKRRSARLSQINLDVSDCAPHGAMTPIPSSMFAQSMGAA